MAIRFGRFALAIIFSAYASLYPRFWKPSRISALDFFALNEFLAFFINSLSSIYWDGKIY